MDGIFFTAGRGLNSGYMDTMPVPPIPNAELACTPDSNGYNIGAPTAINFWRWSRPQQPRWKWLRLAT